MSFRRLRLATIVVPIAFITIVVLASEMAFESRSQVLARHVVQMTTMIVGVVAFSLAVFWALDRMNRRIVRQNEELSALDALGRAVSESEDLDQAMTVALERTMKATASAAGEIVIDAQATGDRPFRLAAGDVGLLGRFPGDVQAPAFQRSAGFASGGVRVMTTATSGHADGAPGTIAIAVVPLVARSQPIGSLRLIGAGKTNLSPGRSERFLAAMGSQIAMAIQANHLFETVLRRSREAEALYEIGLDIASLQDLQGILDAVVAYAREILRAEASALCLVGATARDLTVAGSSGPREAFLRTVERRDLVTLPLFDRGAATRGRVRSCPVLARDFRANHLSAPLRIGDSVIGDLCVSGREPREFSEYDRKLLAGLADMATIAINNARLIERERDLATLEERERLSRELHDSLAQALGYLHLKAVMTSKALAADDVPRAVATIEDMASTAREAYQDVREAILGLRETVSDTEGVAGTLREYLQKFGRQTGIRTQLRIEAPEPPRLSAAAEIQLVRVIQEALTNVRKHAQAEDARVVIQGDSSGTVITVEDNGRGFDLSRLDASGQQFGIRTMRERMERVGGLLEIDSSPGRGTRVSVRFMSKDGEGNGSIAGAPGRRPAALS